MLTYRRLEASSLHTRTYLAGWSGASIGPTRSAWIRRNGLVSRVRYISGMRLAGRRRMLILHTSHLGSFGICVRLCSNSAKDISSSGRRHGRTAAMTGVPLADFWVKSSRRSWIVKVGRRAYKAYDSSEGRVSSPTDPTCISHSVCADVLRATYTSDIKSPDSKRLSGFNWFEIVDRDNVYACRIWNGGFEWDK